MPHHSRSEAGEYLLGWVPIGALVALIVNDVYAKQRFPGWVTGKISDAAGLVLAVLVILAVIEWTVQLALAPTSPPGIARVVLVVVFVVVGFCLVKTNDQVASFYGACLTAFTQPFRWLLSTFTDINPRGRVAVIADPTDLFALLALSLLFFCPKIVRELS